MNTYLLFKSLHLIAVVSWMAGLLYLPRIFVYHVENKEKKEATSVFEVMERKLFFYIMRPAMIFTWVFGLVLIYLNGIEIFLQLWFQIKIVLVILLSAYNDFLGKCLAFSGSSKFILLTCNNAKYLSPSLGALTGPSTVSPVLKPNFLI